MAPGLMTQTREVHLARRPQGWPVADDFELVTASLPGPGDGELLVRNLYMSVDPYMRGRMNDVPSYVPPFQLGQPMSGGAIGEVLTSNAAGLAVGDLVMHELGWREHAIVPPGGAHKVASVPGVADSQFLGALGMTGLTAYAGLLDIAGFREGETVFVSGAAGAVGSVAGQIARLRGAARVVGSAGSAEKVSYLTGRLGFDAAFNYRDGKVRDLLAEAAPDGIDVYFDNVGGEHLEAAIGALKRDGRAALCGAISQYNDTKAAPGPRNLTLAIGKRLRLQGFIVTDHFKRFGDMIAEVGPWVASGDVVAEETVVNGLHNAAGAFIGMLRGENTGKMIVRLS
jgi:NADPH-dependent curcumin reductase CurA